MEELGLFPLGIVLLPTEELPLHIFEPRYRQLLADLTGLPDLPDDPHLRRGMLSMIARATSSTDCFGPRPDTECP